MFSSLKIAMVAILITGIAGAGMYVMKFGYFCSVNCGLVWACHEIQRRIDNRKGSPRNPLPPEERSKLQKIMDNLKENK